MDFVFSAIPQFWDFLRTTYVFGTFSLMNLIVAVWGAALLAFVILPWFIYDSD